MTDVTEHNVPVAGGVSAMGERHGSGKDRFSGSPVAGGEIDRRTNF